MRFCIGLLLVILQTNPLFARQADSLKNVRYGNAKSWKDADQPLSMDVYFPVRESGKHYPLVMLMHGGGFLYGSKEAMRSHCKILADSGFIAVTINYRKGWERGYKLRCNADLLQLQKAVYRSTQDANTALRFLMSQRNEYTIDTAWIFVGGSSAGGVLALNLAYLKQEAADKLLPEASQELGLLRPAAAPGQSFSIKGICNMWGALSDSSLVTRQNALPTIFYHGTDDIIVPFDIGRFGTMCRKYPLMYGSACIYRQTVAAGKAAILNVSQGGNHGPKEFYSKITMSNTACFFKQVIQGRANGATIYNIARAGCR